jgi:glycerol uptake facilitator-like aquaporin
VLTKASLHQIAFFEIAGMFMFTYGITCASSPRLLDLQVSLAVIVSVAFCGFLCGATLNPCVALMNLIRKENKITWRMTLTLFFSQIIGTLMGGALGYALNGVELHGFLPI